MLVTALVVVVGQSGKQAAQPPSQTVGIGVVVVVGSAVVGINFPHFIVVVPPHSPQSPVGAACPQTTSVTSQVGSARGHTLPTRNQEPFNKQTYSTSPLQLPPQSTGGIGGGGQTQPPPPTEQPSGAG